MPRRVVLHVGTHKTGSTSLQYFLRDNNELLRATAGISYPPGLVTPTAHVELALLAVREDREWPARLRVPEVRSPQWLAAARRHVEQTVSTTDTDTVVYSHEDLSYVRFEDELDRLAALFGGLEVLVVVFLRDRAAYLRSYREQLEATGFPASTDPTSFAYVEADSWLVDYDSLVDGYRACFGTGNVDVLDYDAVVQSDGSVIPAFAATLGLDPDALPDHRAYFLNQAGSNVRPTPEQIAAVRRRVAGQ